jgi:hypothetical protein
MEFRLEYNELTHFSLSVIEQKGVIASLKSVYRTNKDALLQLVYSREVIASAVQRLADAISNDYAGQELLLVVVLKGAFFFAADLSRRLRLPLEIDFVKLASYQLQRQRNLRQGEDYKGYRDSHCGQECTCRGGHTRHWTYPGYSASASGRQRAEKP